MHHKTTQIDDFLPELVGELNYERQFSRRLIVMA